MRWLVPPFPRTTSSCSSLGRVQMHAWKLEGYLKGLPRMVRTIGKWYLILHHTFLRRRPTEKLSFSGHRAIGEDLGNLPGIARKWSDTRTSARRPQSSRQCLKPHRREKRQAAFWPGSQLQPWRNLYHPVLPLLKFTAGSIVVKVNVAFWSM